MTEAEIIARIEPLFRELFEEYAGPVTAALTPADVREWDSLANVELMVMIERAFGVAFTEREVISGFPMSLGEVAALVA